VAYGGPWEGEKSDCPPLMVSTKL